MKTLVQCQITWIIEANITSDDVDTELYRLMAAKAVQINRAEKKSKTWSNDSRQSGSISTMNDPEHQNEAGSVCSQRSYPFHNG